MKKNKLDDLIRSALRAEPMRPVPRGLQSKVCARLSVVALIERERRLLRNVAAFCGMLFTFFVTSLLLFWMFKAWLAPMLFDMPGAMGWWDYVAFSMRNSIAGIFAVAAIIGSVAFVLLLWSVLPRHYTTN
jgi:hypothetical protein